MNIFINYRREDSEAYARLLHDRLAQVYGTDSVFLDVLDLKPGLRWLEQIKASSRSCGVFLALIGPSWMPSIENRAQARFENPAAQDMVRREIEFALTRGSGVDVIPVLVGGAQMPSGENLVRSIRALASLQAVELRHAHFDQDLERLMAALDDVRDRAQPRADEPLEPDLATASWAPGSPVVVAPASAPPVATSNPMTGPGAPRPAAEGNAPAPDERHFDTVLRYMLDEDGVVPVLGSYVNADRPAQKAENGPEILPTAEELAAELAQRFGLISSERLDLAKVAQHVYLTSGSPDLYKGLKRLLSVEAEPSAVHRFLAGFPHRLEERGLEKRPQMIVTTNYDDALERAFDTANEEYDVAVYIASGTDRGRFVHIPFEGDPEVIVVPNRYGKLPIDENGEVQRSLIVKVHGAVDGNSGPYRWKDNYVITEDQYIEYLSHSAVESLVPIQILDKLTAAHCLFLGYSMHDWNLRVFLKRIWQGTPIPAKSWAIERDPGVLESDFWRHFGVDLLAAPLADYVNQLARKLGPVGSS